MQNEKKKRSLVFDIIKLVLAIVILLYHYNVLFCDLKNPFLVKGGYIAVDVFFAISGYFFYFTLHRKEHIRPFHIVLNKMKKMWPDYLICLACSVIAWYLLYGITRTDVFQIAKEILYMQEWLPPFHTIINGPSWYISALLFCVFILALVYRLIPVNLRIFILGFLFAFGLSVMLFKYGTIRIHGVFLSSVFSTGVIRGFVGMIIGLGIGYLSTLSFFEKHLSFAWIIFILGGTGVVAFFFIADINRYDLLCIPFIFIFLLGAVMLTKTNTRVVPYAVTCLFADLSLHIYLLQKAWQMICLRFFPEINIFLYCIVMLFICLLWSVIKSIVVYSINRNIIKKQNTKKKITDN